MVDKQMDKETSVRPTFWEYMSETHPANRWLIAKVFLGGMFAGAVLMAVFAMLGLL